MINKKWDIVLKDEFHKEYFKKLGTIVKKEYKTKIVYPKYENIFNALRYTDYDEVKVVILGQDPYHGENEAHGLSFSVLPGVKRPPSLNNMFKELNDDLGIVRTQNTLTDWTQQGVMMLNSIMTVVKDKPLSHKGIGWEIFTDTIIQKLNEREDPVIFVLWGGYARSKKALITNRRHFIIEAAHPSPLSAHRGFFGSKPYSKINTILKRLGKEEIDWSGNYHKEDS
ncbi:MAG TPA: uracil-DNA glycosylase [Candidatus Fimihabitans intestinipullorum]|uniref:Uracil-DNA glycosylase n=1 Tax=Candidatus Fimihabitans intestinipullorum TaxID=2840820 RepID=A0A9D1HV68_9BACT|nr:uracil-DNA glycosylase [Candidatus Fimihabitans intestinipullorum]